MSLLTPIRQSRPRADRRSTLWQVDWVLVIGVLALSAIGSLLIWSATYNRTALTDGNQHAFLLRHALNFAIGLVLAVLAAVSDHRRLRILAPVLYALSVVGLILVLVPGVGAVINGSRSWIQLPGMSIQPSEFAKLAVIVGMALLIAEKGETNHREARTIDIAQAIAVAAIPVLLVMLQPDLGTVMVLGSIVFGIVAVSGVPKRWMLGIVTAATVIAVLAIQFNVLKKYQLARFTAFADPASDPQGIGYNVNQARIAIGNGGVFGQGLFHGSQTQNAFVPEQHTDFVFTVAGEELGLIATGVVCWFAFQAFENIGMTLGIMPVTGLPLPFVSYGGSSMLAGLLAVGLLQNIHLRSHQV
jgi:rod shape determining protein RodA